MFPPTCSGAGPGGTGDWLRRGQSSSQELLTPVTSPEKSTVSSSAESFSPLFLCELDYTATTTAGAHRSDRLPVLGGLWLSRGRRLSEGFLARKMAVKPYQ